ncbi:SurA N-terminal domain-containing protein [Pelistega europaea]|uniref:Periplasmic chaperone PpiD n=1 Tax=Pelistega europaea TaxID=106147 RepID=A0A7Y4P4P1_9BURK|nr:SurA N-terminal domain-containing protein [Pelistega europaea]NOL50277.1 peptidylprolyl isomerase [Pelistega europaea]
MLDFFRTHSRLVMILLIVLVLPSFVFFGVYDYQSFTSNDIKLVTINEQKITQSDFNRSWTERLNELRTNEGVNFDLTKADTPATREAWLNSLINSAVTQEIATKERFSASNAMVRYALAQDPQLQENGQFSMEAYNRFLTGIGATSQQYEEHVRGYEALRLVVSPVAESAIMPSPTLKALGDAMTEERKVRIRPFKNADYAKDIHVSDEELGKWYETNSASFKVPEYVNLDYVVLNQDAAMAQVKTPSDADLEAYYKNNIARFSKEERRHVKHIQVADLATAQEVEAKAKQNPSQFDALAKEYSQDAGTKNTGGDLGMLKKGDIPDLDDGVFALAQPGITDPVKIGNNYHVFQIVSIEAGGSKSFDEVKTQISDEVRMQLASERFADMATELTHLVQDQRDSLQPVADKLGLKIQTADGITRSGLLTKAQLNATVAGTSAEHLFTLPRVRETAFSAEVFAQGLNSGVIELSPSELLVIRVKDKVAEHVPSLADVHAQALARLTEIKAEELAKKAGEEALLHAKVSGSTEGFDEEELVIDRLNNAVSEVLVNAVMNAPAASLPQYVGVELGSAYVIARIESVTKNASNLKNIFDQYQAPALNSILANEVARAFTINLRQKAKVEIFPDAQKVINGDDKQE